MLQSLINRAQRSIDNALSDFASKALVATPFVIAAGFAVAAITIQFHRWYDPLTANLLLAAGFASMGVLVGLVEAARQRLRRKAAVEPAAASANGSDSQADEPVQPAGADAEWDRELVLNALTSIAPVALPYIVRGLMKNLPLVMALVAAGFVMMRDPENANGQEPSMQPAE